MSFKTRFWKYFKWLAALYFLLFIFRLIYGYSVSGNQSGNDFYSSDYFSNIENIRKNYASEKIQMNNSVQVAAEFASNQKFEKTAIIKTKTSEFDKDEKTLKNKTNQYNAVIQYEQSQGLKGNRELHLLIGVSPEKFDSFYVDVQKIGLVKAAQITKVDKTNEYKQLNAKKASLEKTLQSLMELKNRAGAVSDFVSLHDKILEVEGNLQELGVELGNFDAVNEFCTVKLSLYEGAAQKEIGFLQRVKVAFEWSVKYFAALVVILLGMFATVFVILLVIDKLNLIRSISTKLNE